MAQTGNVDAQHAAVGNPPLALPKGGGAIRGIGETFQTNEFSGTGNFTIPIAVSPSRAGFGPTLNLQYSSGNGNGVFGLGWELSIPRVTRKTEKGLPKYDSNDVFVLSGAEDLVPQFQAGTTSHDSFTFGSFTIQRYRPRTEGLFARIERWLADTGDVHWRVTTRNNVTSIYGRTSQARITHPSEPGRIYEWLLEESFDARGNHIYYEYVADDPALRINRVHEQHRSYCQRYLRRICYGNLGADIRYGDGAPVGVERQGIDHRDRTSLTTRRYVFEVVFDYEDGGASQTINRGQEFFDGSSTPVREDAFSTFRAGFEVRTLRRCKRVLMYHHFVELNGPTLVRSTWFEYQRNPHTSLSLLTSVTVKGHRTTDSGAQLVGEMPPISFRYYEFQPQRQRFQPLEALGGDLPSFPLTSSDVALVDLFGDGLPDVLQTTPVGFRYWKNLGNGLFDRSRFLETSPPGVVLSNPDVSLADMDGDGRLELLLHGSTLAGYYEATPTGSWENFRHYQTTPTFSLSDPNMRMVDLTGDGRSDALLTRDHHFVWFECLGEAGYAEGRAVERLHDLENFPDVYFEDPGGRLRLADMSGDGLADIVLLHNGRIDYWPNLGYGRFGKRITMGSIPDPPMLDATFDPKRLFLVDLDGTGCADLVYVEFDRIHFWFNQSGNSFSARQTIRGTPLTYGSDSVQFADVFGSGTATLLWSYHYGLEPGSNYKALDFCGGVKPYVLCEMDNNMGAKTRVRYRSSTQFAIAARRAGKPWVTRLPFPVHVVDKVEVIDRVGKTKLVNSYEYHHGYFDGREREFRGFGRVDRLDTEFFEEFSQSDLHGSGVEFVNSAQPYYSPPVLTKTWHHTGAYFAEGRQLLERYREEYYQGDPSAFELSEHEVEIGNSAYEAYRVLRGAVLRTEVYALDSSSKELHPYVVATSRHAVHNLQPATRNLHGVFLTVVKESISHHYERNPADPRVAHEITLAVDSFGNITDSVSIGYPRRQPMIAEQGEIRIVYGKHDFINSDKQSCHRVGVTCQSRTFEITGISPSPSTPLRASDFDSVRADIRQPFVLGRFLQPGEAVPTTIAKRLIAWSRVYFRSDATFNGLDVLETGAGRLPLGQIESLGLPYESYTAVFNSYLVTACGTEPDHSSRVTPSMLEHAGYRQLADVASFWWIPAGRQSFNAALFYESDRTRDQFGSVSQINLDRYALLPIESLDALGNQITVSQDYHVLQPFEAIDPNGARGLVAYDPLGMVIATATQGHSGEGDSLDDVPLDLSRSETREYLDQPLARGAALLGSATTRMIYDLHAFKDRGSPVVVATFGRERHAREEPNARLQHDLSYSDGFGRVVQRKVPAEAGPLPSRDTAGRLVIRNGVVESDATNIGPRWVASGSVTLNNKGAAVKEYEPFFTDSPRFESEVLAGSSSTAFFDPLSRLVATLHPNRSYDKVVFDSWTQETWDANDTATSSPDTDSDVGPFFRNLPRESYSPTWYEERVSGSNAATKRAAEMTEAHAGTPSVIHVDTLGRPVMAVANTGTQLVESKVQLDIQGNSLKMIDSRGVEIFRHTFDLANRKLVIDGRDSGLKCIFLDAADKPSVSWDANLNRISIDYDELQRPTNVWVKPANGLQFLAQHTTYGEALSDPASTYHRTRVYRVRDGAGEFITPHYDFKGNPLEEVRTLCRDYTVVPDWNQTVSLQAESFRHHTVFDALNRITERTENDGTVIEHKYNAASLLESVVLTLPRASGPTVVVTDVSYNSKGQRLRIAYGNRVTAEYEYDPHTFKLSQLRTKRNGELVQELGYTHDAVGNVTEIYDGSFDRVFNSNEVIDPVSRYIYDATYRLVRATGREHTGLTACSNYRGDKKQTEPIISSQPQPLNNAEALRNYSETYEYDSAGNLEAIRHIAAGGNWTRKQSYESRSNRLLTSDAGCSGEDLVMPHDANGNITKLPHLDSLGWDYLDRLVTVVLNSTNSGEKDKAHYAYDASGLRIRKVLSQGVRTYERIYFGGFELYRERNNGALSVERRTINVVDDQKRVISIETRSDTSNPSEQRIRYHLDNHLGSSIRELDDQGRTITYEEFYPFGGTAYLAGENQVEVDRKRFRYCGKERDDETGCYYFGARYYAPWLGRWLSCDPLGSDSGLNQYVYVSNNPIRLVDPTGLDDIDAFPNEVMYTSDPIMAEQINQLTRNSMPKALDLETGNWFPYGAAGGTFVLVPDDSLSTKVPSLGEALGIKGELEIAGLTIRNDMDILGGYTLEQAYKQYFITPERQITLEGGTVMVMPAQIKDLGEYYSVPVTAPLNIAGDVAVVAPAARGGAALVSKAVSKGPALSGAAAEANAYYVYRRMSFEEAKKTLKTGQLQPPANYDKTWISFNKKYVYNYPSNKGKGDYDVMLRFKLEPGSESVFFKAGVRAEVEKGAQNLGIPTAEIPNLRFQSIEVFSTQPTIIQSMRGRKNILGEPLRPPGFLYSAPAGSAGKRPQQWRY